MSLEEAQTLVMNARVQLGWVDAADPGGGGGSRCRGRRQGEAAETPSGV